MTPETDREREIAARIDKQAKAWIEAGQRWEDVVFAMDDLRNSAEVSFAERYKKWRLDNPPPDFSDGWIYLWDEQHEYQVRIQWTDSRPLCSLSGEQHKVRGTIIDSSRSLPPSSKDNKGRFLRLAEYAKDFEIESDADGSCMVWRTW